MGKPQSIREGIEGEDNVNRKFRYLLIDHEYIRREEVQNIGSVQSSENTASTSSRQRLGDMPLCFPICERRRYFHEVDLRKG